jgi:hypothetical protein
MILKEEAEVLGELLLEEVMDLVEDQFHQTSMK